mmetsp:Transcript_8934/g.20752  ORF Transcript_8934/g.20752 Transcript_8934/m.20752 type:complete len:295 (+) Transcript_8934:38-922(+)
MSPSWLFYAACVFGTAGADQPGKYECSPITNKKRATRSLRRCEQLLASKCNFHNALVEPQGGCQAWDADMPPPATSLFEGTEASELGCVSRSTTFGRGLWCLARGMRNALELFTGIGAGTTLLLAHAMAYGGTGQAFDHGGRAFYTVERDEGNAYHAVRILASVGIPARIIELDGPHGLTSSQAQLLKDPGVWILLGDLFQHVGMFASLCDAVGGLDLVMLDPPVDLRMTWPLLESACSPKFLAVHNTNLPGHAGWLRTLPRAPKTQWYEMMNGSHDSIWEAGVREWSLMGQCR